MCYGEEIEAVTSFLFKSYKFLNNYGILSFLNLEVDKLSINKTSVDSSPQALRF